MQKFLQDLPDNLRRHWRSVLFYGGIMLAAVIIYQMRQGNLDERWAACQGGPDVNAVIDACSELLASDDLDDNDMAKALIFRGGAYLQAEKGIQAAEDFFDAIKRDPEYAAARFWLGVASQTRGDHEGAIAHYDDAIRLRPDYVEAYMSRAHAQVQRANFDAALPDFNRVIEMGADTAEALNGRCFVRAMLGAGRDALSDCNRALEKRPQFYHALDSRALAYYRLDEFAQALEDSNQAIAQSTQANWELHATRAAILYRLGRRAEAAKDLQLAQRLAGGAQIANDRIKLIGLDPERLAAGR